MNYRNNCLKDRGGIWQNYAISENSTINNGKLYFVINGKNEVKYNNFNSADLSPLPSGIKLSWHPQKCTSKNNNYNFHYLIVEVC